MSFPKSLLLSALALALLSMLQACGDSQENTKEASTEKMAAETTSAARSDASPGSMPQQPEESEEVQTLTVNGSEVVAADAESTEEYEEIDPDSLEAAGRVELKQYSVAWVGSGTIGGGTLTMDGESYPFKIVGLGVGGFGASSVEATGVVYNLPDREAFAGTYGNARLGLTAGDSGGGKLWLRNSDDVVIELESEMRGLALAGGVDGLVIQWDEKEKSSVDDAMDGTEEVVGKGIEAGADAVETGIGKVKGWLKKDGG
ncbi:MAG: hypothetical protein ABJK25_03785 [Halieaceae bacterium]